MDYKEKRLRFGRVLQGLRTQQGTTQEQLAARVGKSTEHISFLERGERSPSFETLMDLADALAVSPATLLDEPPTDSPDVVASLVVAPISDSLPEPAQETSQTEEKRESDLERLNSALHGIREMQKLADEYGISDILQDNGGKVLQVLILLGLTISPGREGNDAVDAEGNEYELKTVNIAKKRSQGVTTHHHLNRDILRKYRAVKAWYIATYEEIELKEIYRISPSQLEVLFAEWEQRIERTGPLNNPKIPMRIVRTGELVYPIDLDA